MLAALWLALAPLAQDPAPLFPPPSGWRTERIPFPLDFAPELDYRGFEDLAFAPGMFQKGSDSYFSYALALELEGDVALDARTLEHVFATYYRGLCRAVGEERKLTLALDTITARVEGGGDHFQAQIECFDPFTDGAPLHLTLELRTHARPGKTELFGIASPLPPDAPVWKELAAVHQAWARARPAAVLLNHVTWVVERATFDALKAEPFLRELAPFEERASGRPGAEAQGFYLYGRRTYLEFLVADEAAGLAPGRATVAFGIERAGASQHLAVELHRAGLPSELYKVPRGRGAEAVPWFELLVLQGAPGPLDLACLEYAPRFLAQWRPELEPHGGTIGRAEVLARYAAALGETPGARPLGDVRLLDLALDAPQREALERFAHVAGYDASTPATDGPSTLAAPGVTLRVTPSASAGGLRGCEFTLTRPLQHAPLTLGRVRVSFDGALARFELAP